MSEKVFTADPEIPGLTLDGEERVVHLESLKAKNLRLGAPTSNCVKTNLEL